MKKVALDPKPLVSRDKRNYRRDRGGSRILEGERQRTALRGRGERSYPYRTSGVRVVVRGVQRG